MYCVFVVGWKKISDTFNLCKKINSSDDVRVLYVCVCVCVVFVCACVCVCCVCAYVCVCLSVSVREREHVRPCESM